MSEAKMTRKEKIAAGLPKPPKKKTAAAKERKAQKEEQAKVILRNYQIAPRKMRMIIDAIRGDEVFHALSSLKFTAKAGAPAVRRLLKSAIASYEEKFDDRVDVGTHYISAAMVDSARMLKRMRPAPQGRGHLIRKRFSHITLVIDAYDQE